MGFSTFFEETIPKSESEYKWISLVKSNDTQNDNAFQSSNNFEYGNTPLHIVIKKSGGLNYLSSEKEENIVFKDMQKKIIEEHSPILYSMLKESEYEMGFESKAERYFNDLYKKFEDTADLILQNIFWDNRIKNIHIVKEILFIIAELPKHRRKNLYYIPITGLDNEDDEVKDLSIRCFEIWNEKENLDILKNHAFDADWLEDYRISVIRDLECTGEE